MKNILIATLISIASISAHAEDPQRADRPTEWKAISDVLSGVHGFAFTQNNYHTIALTHKACPGPYVKGEKWQTAVIEFTRKPEGGAMLACWAVLPVKGGGPETNTLYVIPEIYLASGKWYALNSQTIYGSPQATSGDILNQLISVE